MWKATKATTKADCNAGFKGVVDLDVFTLVHVYGEGMIPVGEAVLFGFDVANRGTDTSPAGTEVAIYVNNEEVGTLSLTLLPAGI